eukprot:CAMPEP_0194543724 /NCGR_PEP_ID=MMETSP0253-20130528/86307_1 /TAXON_ID=2966 /ORGANISM="Noctiluca scintillans" /LENGTH=112 /DNA_ID=CAMNT_0039390517 /DNA_START=529 /DNA_END=867 /DNA_ORIENTATION=-
MRSLFLCSKQRARIISGDRSWSSGRHTPFTCANGTTSSYLGGSGDSKVTLLSRSSMTYTPRLIEPLLDTSSQETPPIPRCTKVCIKWRKRVLSNSERAPPLNAALALEGCTT